jgi:hypothetical protein
VELQAEIPKKDCMSKGMAGYSKTCATFLATNSWHMGIRRNQSTGAVVAEKQKRTVLGVSAQVLPRRRDAKRGGSF